MRAIANTMQASYAVPPPTGDPATDTSNIKAALAAASGGGKVVLAAGTYKVNAHLFTATGVSIEGAGSGATTIDATAIRNDAVILGPGNNIGATYRGFKLSLTGASPNPQNLAYGSWAIQNVFGAGNPLGFVLGISPGAYATYCMMEDVFVIGGAAGIVIAGSTHQLINCQATQALCHNLAIDFGKQSTVRDDMAMVVQGGCYHVVLPNYSGIQPANVRVDSSVGGPTYPSQILFDGVLCDEPGAPGGVSSSNIDIARGEAITFSDCYFYVPVGVSTQNRYGIRVRSGVRRTTIRNCWIGPWVHGDTNRYATNTILIEAGATDTRLQDLVTDTSGGGGDIADLGTRTQYRNVNGEDQLPANRLPYIVCRDSGAAMPVGGLPNDACFMAFELTENRKVTGVRVNIVKSSGNLDIGIYQGSKRITSLGSTAAPATGVQSLMFSSPVYLTPGSYYLAIAADNLVLTFYGNSLPAATLFTGQARPGFPLPASLPSLNGGATTVIASVLV